jgi:hypothetical protein
MISFKKNGFFPEAGRVHRQSGFKGRMANRSLTAAGLTLALLLAALTLPGAALAQVEGYPDPAPRPQFSLSVTPVYQFPAHLGGGGTLSLTGVLVSADVVKQFDRRLGVGLSFNYDFFGYTFSGDTGFPVNQPWAEVQRLGFSLPVFLGLSETWQLLVTPTAQFSGEIGADWGESMIYGGSLVLLNTKNKKRIFGIGLGGYAHLEEIRIFPFPVIKWQITDRLRLANPFRSGPAGPAGLELSYALKKPWEIGLGGAYRSYRFRLDARGPVPHGIGEHSTIPVFVRLSYKPAPVFGVDVYAGATFLNKLYLDDRDGDNLYRTKHSVAPLLGASVSGRF